MKKATITFRRFFFILLFTFISSLLFPQEKYALLIGINEYQSDIFGIERSEKQAEEEAPKEGKTDHDDDVLAGSLFETSRGSWRNLEGCANDVLAIKEIINIKYSFNEDRIQTLIDKQATREGIFEALNTLLEKVKKGDVVFIFYAGHGSQVSNSLSPEADKLDETIVPVDAAGGVYDIRDKELALIFDKFLKKGVLLTIIFDSCHSGSIARGKLSNYEAGSRHVPADRRDVKDPGKAPEPEKHGALLISAAQDFQYAKEMRDAFGNIHGAFTYALIQTLNNLPVSASSVDIFESIRAILKYHGQVQEPVLAANEARRKQGLFGDISDEQEINKIAMIGHIGGNVIEMQGGYAIGLNVNAELEHVSATNEVFRLKVLKMTGVNRCEAELLEGNPALMKSGMLFQVSKWSIPACSVLQISLNPSPYSPEELRAIYKSLMDMEKDQFTIIQDPYKETYENTIFYEKASWYLGTKEGIFKLGTRPDPEMIKEKCAAPSSIFLNLPLVNAAVEVMNKTLSVGGNLVAVNENLYESQYVLSGRFINNSLEYSLIMTDINNKQNVLNPLPVRSDFIPYEGNNLNFSKEISKYAYKIAKIKAWLSISNPDDNRNFPFELLLLKAGENTSVKNGEKVFKNEQYGLILNPIKDKLENWDKKRRYIYVFLIDSRGATQLLFPLSGNVENKLPLEQQDIYTPIKLGPFPLFEIDEPYGIDTYVMISSEDPISNPTVLNQEGVITRSNSRNSGIDALLNTGDMQRGDVTTPVNWNIQRLTVRSFSN
jgi:hypothetical protein